MYNEKRSFYYENGFYLTAKASRIAKFLAHYELYKISSSLPGDIVECGVFRGASLMRFIMFQQLFGLRIKKKVIGFDMFGKFPLTSYKPDRVHVLRFICETGGGKSISKTALERYIRAKNFTDFELVKGDICKTVPKFIKKNPNLKISILNIDTDLYEPTKVIIQYLAPRVVKGGVIIFDNYNVFPGETEIAGEFSKKHGYHIRRYKFAKTPSYLIKD